ncbi:molybdenum cofactor guanylyltransferase [Paenibacillus flagellatus]|uniref:Probable molybdenum cofactor guanylyltransferase n=1 Tax=Paenibacillus flagellatus TaxID=2211139 RepID=A0A2V5L0N6_9BACL|nr:molybdenum cofactor guanylyltransferase [Paenibacillus flagellatus]PYI56136.1 molybdenum cofactor guanylyltransferase [Paenibacillus flagellatus]
MLTGVVLAGGENRRMGGKPKALLEFGGEPMIRRQLRLMAGACSELLVVTNDPRLLLSEVDRSVRIVTDYYPGNGPLGGIHAALSLCRSDYAWIVGCDMPFVSADAAGVLLEAVREAGADAAVPSVGGKLQPLHGVYRTNCAEEAERLLREETYRVMEWIRRIRHVVVSDDRFAGTGIDTRFAVNANTPEQWDEARRLERDG